MNSAATTANSSNPFAKARRWRALWRLVSAWPSSANFASAIYVTKVVLAALLALLISLALNLESPRTAMFSVYLVMQARSGLVFQKSYYRLLGTVVGAVVSVILIGAFAQTPELFFIGFALWVALCTAGSFIFRNFQSYGFVLAGYTVCFVALPTIDAPTQVFDVAVTRVLEMFVGVFCAAVVSDTLFPQRMADVVHGALVRRFQDFTRVLSQAPAQLRAGDTGKAAMLRFAGDALGLEAAHTNAGLESSDLRRLQSHLQLLNHEFMGVTSTLHAFHQMLRRLQQGGDPAIATALLGLYEPFSGVCQLASGGVPEADVLLPKLAAWRSALGREVAAVREQLPLAMTRTDRLDFDTGVELLERLGDEFRAYCITQAKVSGAEVAGESGDADLATERVARLQADADSLRFSTRTDPVLALLAALRGVGVMAVTAGFWLASGWSWGTGPIINGVASGTVFAALPSPAKLIRQVLIGWCFALPLGLVWNFLLIPQATDWIGLCVLLIPPLALIAWLASSPKWGGIGAGMYISFMLHTSLDRSFNANLPDFLDACFADFIGFAVSGTFYALIDLNAGPWGRRRIVGALRQQMVDVCRGEGRLRREVLESTSRDLVQRIATRGQLADETDVWVFDWLLTVLEIGRAVIDLRAEMDAADADALPLSLAFALHRLGDLFSAPTPASRHSATLAVEAAIATLDGADARLGNRRRRALVLDLHFIRCALADPVSVLDGKGGRHG